MKGGEEGSFSFIAQTTGVSLIPSFLGRDREMRGLFTPHPSSSHLQDSWFSLHFLRLCLGPLPAKCGAAKAAHSVHIPPQQLEIS